MADENNCGNCDILRFGKPGEKLELLRELEETAKDCRSRADRILPACRTAAERERIKPWREFRREIGFPLFSVVLKIAQKNTDAALRGLAGDILAHLWHPAGVPRLLEDITGNDDKLLLSQVLGIFENLAGIGEEMAVKALIAIWEYGWHALAARALGACGSRRADAFLLAQAQQDEDADIRGLCVSYLNAQVTPKKVGLLLDKLKYCEGFEQAAAIKKIKDLGLSALAGDLKTAYEESEDAFIKQEIQGALRAILPGR